ncbi:MULTISPECIES: high-potential iron-sulfur protein [Halobellus]|uniref:high-potential iron-sulfur protein n=1 Tax=Halobellus TaxID=1073986 RepID=UPI00211564DE|nr:MULTISPECIES: high-potential iron-sulfur protein [Halobellus]MDQ2053916.1 high-potential iron-sulfur protein [Halobellus sp. H-GB7]
MRGRQSESRRRFLQLAGSSAIVGAAGCAGTPEQESSPTEPADDEDGDRETDTDEELPEGVSADEFEHGPVPQEYRTADSIGGETRTPDELQIKADVQFSEYDEALENAAHQPGRCCANCSEYIADRNGDGFGACAAVEGYIGGADWCTIWEELPEPEVPEGMSEDELATAEVPTEYRTAISQAGEERDPDELLAQANVSFGESVEKIADGVAQPGMSCGNCAEFIPDKNGDGWGACAAVEGYIAVEDWCAAWEAVSEELE